MARNGAGIMVRIHSWAADAAASLKISSSRMDADTNDIANEITNSLAKDGQTTPTANLPMGGFKHLNVADATLAAQYATLGQLQNGSIPISATSFTVTGSAIPTNGMYLPAANTVGWAINSALKLSLNADNLVFATGLGALLPDTITVLTNTMTDATNKSVRLSTKHYTNAEEPTGLISAVNTSTTNLISIGGGNVAQNAATQIDFYAAANTTTTTGTSKMSITNTGVGLGGQPATAFQIYNGVFRTGTTIANEHFDIDRDNVDGFLRFNGAQASSFCGYKFRIRGADILRIEDSGVVGLQIGQLKFPATQNASTDVNTLDDYEEGTFTPSLQFGGASAGVTYSVQSGYYTKIGRLVSVMIYLTLTAKGTSTGSAQISGLPFSASVQTAISIRYFTVTYGGTVIGDVSGTLVTLAQLSEAGSHTSLNDTNFANTSVIQIQATYIV